MTAQAHEKGGQGNADARVEVGLTPSGGGHRRTADLVVHVTGRAAQTGEAMVGPVTEQLIEGFTANLAKI